MRTKIALLSSLAALLAFPALALAVEIEPPKAPAPGGAAGQVPPAPADAPAKGPNSETASEPPAPAEASGGPAAWPGWIRIDSDAGGVQFWGGATAPMPGGYGLAFDIYVFGNLGEFDFGPSFSVGDFTLTPMIGTQFDFGARTFAALVPQFYATGGPAPVYGELWVQYYNYEALYDYKGKVNDGAFSFLYTRLFADYKLSDYVAVGPQFEFTYNTSDSELVSLPVGGSVILSNAGVASSFVGFLGYETKDPTGADNHLAGRLTFIHNF